MLRVMAELRYDRAELGRPTKLPNGMLRLDARVAKTGVLVYKNGAGQERREYVPPEALFHSDHLDSLRLAPLTLRHPPTTEMVTAENAARFVRGAIEAPRRDGDYLSARLVVMHQDAVEAVERGVAREISEGYEVVLDETPGVTPDGQRYDAIQRARRTNHVALVEAGRAGPDVSVRYDAADFVLVDVIPPTAAAVVRADASEGSIPMKKIRIDGVDYEAPEQTVQAFEAALAKKDEETKSLRADAAEVVKAKSVLEAERDTLRDKLEQAEKLRQDAADPAHIEAAVKARLDLERKASRIVKNYKADGKSDDDIRRDVIAAMFPKASLEGKDATYLVARFDSAVELFEDGPNVALEGARRAAQSAQGSRADSADDVEAARQKMIEFNRSRGAPQA
jgi:hypothetical protein